MQPNPSKFLGLQRRISKRGENICLRVKNLWHNQGKGKKWAWVREREIKENTRWGSYNFLTKGSLQCQESQIRGCFLGRRKSPRGARAQPVSHGDITNRLLTLKYFSYQWHPQAQIQLRLTLSLYISVFCLHLLITLLHLFSIFLRIHTTRPYCDL